MCVPGHAASLRKVPLKQSRVGKGTCSVPALCTQTGYEQHFLWPYHTICTTPRGPNMYGSSDLHIIEWGIIIIVFTELLEFSKEI